MVPRSTFFILEQKNFKAQSEMEWLWMSKYNKIEKHGRSFYLKVELLNSNLSV